MEQLNPMAIGATNTSPNLQAIRLKQERKNAPKQYNPTDVNINVTDFDTSGFPDFIQRFIADTSAFINMDENSVSIAVLQALAVSMGANNFYNIKAPNTADEDYFAKEESLNMFSLLVAGSGSGKTPLFKTVLNQINEHDKNLRRDYKQKRKEWEKERTEPEPKNHGLVINNLTVEGLLQQSLHNSNDNCEMQLPVLISTDEASGFFKKLEDMGKHIEAPAFLCNAWDGLSYSICRKQESYKLDRMLVHFMGAVQTGIFEQILKDNPDFFSLGLINRFIIYIDRTKEIKSPFSVKRNIKSELAFHALITSKITDIKKVYNFTNEATASYISYFDNIGKMMNQYRNDNSIVSEMLGKIGKITAKIAVIFAGANNRNNVENVDVLNAIKVSNFIITNNLDLLKRYSKQGKHDPSLSECSTSELYDAFLNRCVTPEKRSQLTPTDVARFVGRSDNYFRR